MALGLSSTFILAWRQSLLTLSFSTTMSTVLIAEVLGARDALLRTRRLGIG